MTNEIIILKHAIDLAKDGIIGTTGRTICIAYPDGTTEKVQEPEAIHTFAAWKQLGYSVRKGEKAVAKFPIWKHTVRKVKDENGDPVVDQFGEVTKEHMFLQPAAWFSAAQVEPIKVGA